MRSQSVRWLIAVAVLALGAALYLTSAHRQGARAGDGEKLYPDLQAHLDDVTELKVYTAGPKLAVTLTKNAQGWAVAERAGYPADVARIRELLLALAKARTVERKTGVAANFPALGVEDLETPEASGKRIDLTGVPLSLLIGKAPDRQSTYVRKAGEPQSWQVDVALNADADPKRWLEADVLEIPAKRVKSVETRIAGQAPWAIAKAAATETEFKVTGIPKGREPVSPAAAGEQASMLAALQLEDVRAKPATPAPAAASATLQTFDGLTLQLEGVVEGDRHFVRIQPSTSADAAEDVRKEGAAIERATRGFELEIPAYKYSQLFKPLAELLQKK
jgi:hypothetical protein